MVAARRSYCEEFNWYGRIDRGEILQKIGDEVESFKRPLVQGRSENLYQFGSYEFFKMMIKKSENCK